MEKLVNVTRQYSGVYNLNKSTYTLLANAINKTLNGQSNTRILFVGDSTTAGSGSDYTTLNITAYSHVRRLSELLTASGLKSGWSNHYGLARINSGNYTNIAGITAGTNSVTIGTSTAITALTPTANYVITSVGAGSNWTSIGATTGFLGEIFTKNATAGVGTGTASVFNTNDTSNMQGWLPFTGAADTSIGGKTLWNTTTTAPITFAPSSNTNALDVYYLDAGASYDAFTVKVGATTYATATNTGANIIRKLTATTGLSANNNIWTIQKAVAGNTAIIVGFEAYDINNKEISLINAGEGGTFIDSSFAVNNPNWFGSLQEITATNSKFDAVVINFGINHWFSSNTHTPAQFETALNFAVDYLIANNVNVILTAPMKSPSVSDGGGTITLATQQLYIDVIYRTAISRNLAVIDIFNTFGTTYNNADILGWHGYTTDVHPSKLGYQVIAKYFKNFIDAIL